MQMDLLQLALADGLQPSEVFFLFVLFNEEQLILIYLIHLLAQNYITKPVLHLFSIRENLIVLHCLQVW